jgi:hypothetical protein
MAFDERNQGSSFLLAVIDYDLRMKRSAVATPSYDTFQLRKEDHQESKNR